MVTSALVAAVEHRVDEDALAHAVLRDPGTDAVDASGDVGALDAGERQRLPAPARVGVRVVGRAVGAFARPDVGVVERGGPDADPHLARSRLRLGNVVAVLELLGPAESGEQYGTHGCRLLRVDVYQPVWLLTPSSAAEACQPTGRSSGPLDLNST